MYIQFETEMNWENQGIWHIDHIIPIKYFDSNYDLTDVKIQKIVFHYLNLQPMWGKENIVKSDTISKNIAKKKILQIKKALKKNIIKIL